MDRNDAHQLFEDELAALIDKHWETLRPGGASDDDELVLEIAEIGHSYASCWVLVLGCSSIENSDAPHMSVRITPRGQLPFTGIGLLEDTLAVWKGVD